MTLAELGLRIRHFRTLRRLTQAMLGRLLHISRQAVAAYERGLASLPAVRVPDLCEALHITPGDLFAPVVVSLAPVKSAPAKKIRRVRCDFDSWSSWISGMATEHR